MWANYKIEAENIQRTLLSEMPAAGSGGGSGAGYRNLVEQDVLASTTRSLYRGQFHKTLWINKFGGQVCNYSHILTVNF